MAEYKRKKAKRSSFNPKKIKNISDNIAEETEREPKRVKEKKPVETEKPQKHKKSDFFSEFKVIKSKKKFKSGKSLKILIAVALIIVITVCVSLALPTGIIEAVSNLFATFGGGDYPVQYNGSLTVDLVQNGSYYYVLNDTSISAFSNKGKEIFTDIHGFTNPVLCVSSERALVFDQNGSEIKIYNLSGLIDTKKTETNIINATICRNGGYAVSCSGVEYTSTVTVYNKNGKKLYVWNSATDIVNNVALSNNGKKLAVSCLNVSGGKAVSSVSVLEYKSAKPVFTSDFGENIILGIRGNSKGFGCITESAYDFFTWRKYEKKEITSKDRVISLVRTNGNDTLLVFNRSSDRSDNRIIRLDSSCDTDNEFDYKTTITDIEFKSGKVFILSDTTLSVFDKEGKLYKSVACDYGCKRFAVCSSDTVAAVTDDSIKKITVE